MADIQNLLNNILKAVFGKDVRQSIHDAIKQCYYDGKAGAVDLEARENIELANERIDNLAKLQEGSTTGDAELVDGRVDYNGNTHTNIGTHIREVSSQLSSEIENLEGTVECKNILVGGMIQGTINSNGVFSSDTNKLVITEKFTRVKPGSTITFSMVSESEETRPTTFGIMLYDLSKNFIMRDTLTRSNVFIGGTYTVTDETHYIKIQAYNSNRISPENVSNVQIEYGDTATEYEPPFTYYLKPERLKGYNKIVETVNALTPTNPLDIIKETAGNTRIFKTIGSIGDSLTEGYCNYHNGEKSTGGVFKDYSYPSQLAKICGNTVYNWGDTGETAESWLTSSRATECFDGEHLCDAYIIGLGTNDSSNNSGVVLGSCDDIDLSNYANNLNTFFGNMGKIIQKIKEVQPKAKIFVCTTLRNYHDNTSVFNEAIREITSLFDNCWLLDFEVYYADYYDENLYTGSAKIHQNALGYLKKAYAIATYIDWIIENNIEEFKDVQLIGTDYIDL